MKKPQGRKKEGKNWLCGLPPIKHLEGVSLWPQLQDANAPRRRPAITSHNQGNFSIVSEKWRYIHYADNTEELYNLKEDPNEWYNLAQKPHLREIKATMRAAAPQTFAQPGPSKAEMKLVVEGESFHWEFK